MNRLILCLCIFLITNSLVSCGSTSNNTQNLTTHLYGYNPKAAQINAQLGLAYLKEGEVERAKHKLLLALRQNPNSSQVQSAFAYFYEKTAELTLAEQYYLKAINLQPAAGEFHNNYGTFLCQQKRFKEAQREFTLAVEDKNYLYTAEAYENLGLCAMENHNYQQARVFFTKALEKNPKLKQSAQALATLNHFINCNK